MFAKLWSQASGRPLKVVTVYPGPAPIGMGRVDAEWVAYNHEEANEILDEARRLLNTFDAEFVAVPSDSASRGLHDVQEAAWHDSIVILGSRKTRGVRRTAPGNTAERVSQASIGTRNETLSRLRWRKQAASCPKG
jgi:nucleotide-binding universal stress UspA family protein